MQVRHGATILSDQKHVHQLPVIIDQPARRRFAARAQERDIVAAPGAVRDRQNKPRRA